MGSGGKRDILSFMSHYRSTRGSNICIYIGGNWSIAVQFLKCPVSYTHLDVYKRQLQLVARFQYCQIRLANLRECIPLVLQ